MQAKFVFFMLKTKYYITKKLFHPISLAVILALIILLYQKILNFSSLCQIVFLRYFFLSLFCFLDGKPKLNLKKIKEKSHLLFFIVTLKLGFIFLILTALKTTPPSLVLTLYLIYPTFIPLVLRIWIGKKFSMLKFSITYLVWLSALLFFKLSLTYFVGASLTLIASIFYAISFCGEKRYSLNFSSFKFLQNTSTAALTSLLLIKSESYFSFKILFFVMLATVLEEFYRRLNQSIKATYSTFDHTKWITLSPIILWFLQSPIQKNLNSFKELSLLILLYCSLYIYFLQKSLLSKHHYKL